MRRRIRVCASAALLAAGLCAAGSGAEMLEDPDLPTGTRIHLRWRVADEYHPDAVISLSVEALEKSGDVQYLIRGRLPFYDWPQSPLEWLLTQLRPHPFEEAALYEGRVRVENGKLRNTRTEIERETLSRLRSALLRSKASETLDLENDLFFDQIWRRWVRLSPDTYYPYVLLSLMTVGPEDFAEEPDVGQGVELFIWTRALANLRTEAVVEAVEEVTVAAGTFECYRVRVTPFVHRHFWAVEGRQWDSYAELAAHYTSMVSVQPSASWVWIRVERPQFVVSAVGGLFAFKGTDPEQSLELLSYEVTEAR